VLYAIGNESVLKIIINDTVKIFFLNCNSILVISNYNSFGVLLMKLLPYILCENIFIF